ncbi:leucine-rich repeats and death domain-containing protein [Sarotherodon galilaeus]
MPKKNKRSQAQKKRWKPLDLVDPAVPVLSEELQSNAVQHFWCVSATHCQSDERYTEFSRNHQCTCNALTFLAYLNEEHQFNTARLDKVLEQGDALYCWIKTHLQQERRYTQNHLTMEDLPKEVHADINVYSVKMDNIRYGYLKAEDKTYQRKGWWLPLASRLVCLSTDVNYALLMVSPQCIAVFRDKSGRYGLFDSHSRSAAGLPQPNGTAVMLTFTHVNDLITHLHNLFQNQGRYARYEFVPVSFKRVSTHNEQPAQSTQATPGATSPQNDEPQITNPTVQVPQPESAQTYMTMLENTSNSSQDKMASNRICEHQLETSVDPTSNIQKEQQEISLNNESDKVKDKTHQKARNVSRLNKRRRGKAIRQAQKSQREYVKAKDKSSTEEVAKKTNKKRHERERYACCREFRMKRLQTMKIQYAENCHYRKQRLLSAKNYYANPHIQEKVKAHKVKRYQSDHHFQRKMRNYIIRRYTTDPDYQTRQKQYVVQRYNTDASFQTRQKQYVVQRYNTDASFQTRQKQYMVQRYNTDASFQTRQKQYMDQKYKEDHVRERKKAYIRTKYASDPNYRHKQKKSIHARYHNDSQFRLHHIQRCAQYQRHKMATTASFAIYKKLCAQRIKKKYRRLVTQFQQGPQSEAQPQLVVNSVMQAATLAFRETIKLGPTHVCTVCHRTLFPNQVQHCKRSKYVTNSHVVDTCLTGKFVHVCDSECTANCTFPKQRMQEWICYNCDSHLQRGKISSIAVANNLALAPIPIELSQLNVLERQLIAKILPFAKIIALPKGQQRAVHGAVVCVPSDVETTVNSLPRPCNEAQLLQVQLKRHIRFKGYQHFYTVNMKNVLAGLSKLKEMHSEYKDVSIDDDATFADPTNQIIETEHDTADADIQDSLPRNFDNQILPERRTTEDTTAGILEPCHDVNELVEPEHSNGEPLQDTEKEKEELRPGLVLDTCMQPPDIAQDILSYGEGIFSIAPAQRNRPVGFFSVPKLEAMAFPVQFPTGQNTLDEARQVKLSPSMYFNTRLFSADTRFATDQSYLFFAQFVTETHMATNSMSIQLRKGKAITKDGRRICNRMLQNKDEVERLINNKDATRFMKPLRGTPAYWEKALKDLHAMVRQLGKPTFFLTFSAAEMRWPEVVEVIKTQQGEQVDFSQLDWNTKCEILRSNPVTVMRLFEKRVDALMTTLILSPAQPIGEVEDYFYRVEFQARGSPHIHLLVWVKDAPKFGSDLEDHVYKFIDKYITCKMPDQNADPELNKIVSEVQVHSRNHSRSCKKGNVSCRFGFPKLPVDQTMITFPSPDDDDDHNDKQHSTSKEKGTNEKQKQKNRRMALAKKQKEAKEKLQPLRDLLCDPNSSFEDLSELLHKCKLTYEQYLDCVFNLSNGHVILLKREPNDCWVNAYNADLLRAWNANMDIQYVIDDYSCLMYMMSYVSKPEFEMTQFLNGVIQEVKKSNVNERDEMKQIMQAYAKHREVSAQESVARTCSLPLKKCSRSVVFIQTDDDALKMSLPMSRLQSMAPDDENVWMSGLPEKYANRPRTPEFERMCLAEFASEYRILYSRQTESKNAIPLLNNMGYIQKRTRGKPAIIRYPRFSEKKQPEKFYSRLLKLYFPHRSNDDLKNTKYPTSEQFYKSGRKHGFAVRPIVTFNKKRYESHGKTMERALEQIEQQGPLINAWNTFAPEVEVDRLECVAQRQSRHDTDENEMDIVPDYQVSGSNSGAMPAIIAPKLSPDFVRKMYQSLNETQASIFYTVREWCFKLVWGHCPEQFFYFVSGGAGCGKSHVIKCIYEEATKILHQLPRFRDQADMSYPAVLLTAFTGTAAFNISGKTLHSLLKLPKSLKPPYQGLGNALDEVRASLSNAEILVIDEISMVSKDLFAYIHWRLQQIKGNKKPFGGMSILAVGDFYQLPPLGKAKPLCVYEDNVLDLWKDYFHMVNLTEIMRQKDDHSFAEVLNRIRVKQKTDSLEANDKALLTQAIHDIKDCPSNVLHIYATNKEVDKHNSATVTALHSDIINIQAEDYRKDPRTGEMVLLADMMKGNKRDLPDNIQAAPGVRVMIIRNLDVEDGLVNGTFGTITNIVTTTQDGPKTVNLIGLTLDNQNSGQKFRRKIQGSSDNLVYIEKCEESTSKKGVLRRQFPMKLAFACTAHKVQGMTMESAVVCLKRVFEPGMAYVALSRTTSLKGLYITDFDERKIYADPAITDALKNMRHASFENARPLLQFLKSVVPTVPTLTIIHHNAQGLPTHMEDMRCHHELSLADVLCITETHLSGSSVSPRFQLEQYNMATRNRHVSYTNHTDMAKVNGGGVAMYYKTVLIAESRKYLQNVTDLEFVVIKVESPVTALIATVYRPPNYSHVRFLPQMQCLLDSLEMMNCQPIIVCGDFNEDLMSRGKKPIQELFQSRGYAQLITAATTEKHTLIDHLYISQPYACLQSGVLNTYHSYHNPIYCVIH